VRCSTRPSARLCERDESRSLEPSTVAETLCGTLHVLHTNDLRHEASPRCIISMARASGVHSTCPAIVPSKNQAFAILHSDHAGPNHERHDWSMNHILHPLVIHYQSRLCIYIAAHVVCYVVQAHTHNFLAFYQLNNSLVSLLLKKGRKSSRMSPWRL
jgi:hypothetical protein